MPHKSMDTMERVDYNNYLRKMRGPFMWHVTSASIIWGTPEVFEGGVRQRVAPAGVAWLRSVPRKSQGRPECNPSQGSLGVTGRMHGISSEHWLPLAVSLHETSSFRSPYRVRGPLLRGDGK